MEFSDELYLSLYRMMILGRQFEVCVEQLATRGVIPASVHQGIGEEATQVGACQALNHEDYLIPTHRGHIAALAKGANPGRLLAEILGRQDGFCAGRAGTTRFFDSSSNILGAQAVLGSVFPIAVGAALTQSRLETGRVVLALFGEGTSSQGTFHEGMNLSSLWNLPVIWICVNNLYSMGTHFDDTSAVPNVADRACAYNMPGREIDGNDIIAVYEGVRKAREFALSGKGPTLIECKTYRHRGHSTFDRNPYRPQEEIQAWLARDPIDLFEEFLSSKSILDADRIARIATQVKQQVEQAEAFALSSPEPQPETAMEYIRAGTR
jgi:pyruvate dehydrogenase E1 component alpha subunit